MDGQRVTPRQDEFVRSLQRQHHLPNALLDNHCVQRFGKPYGRIDRAQASALIDEMLSWEALPADLARAKGQSDLPGFGP